MQKVFVKIDEIGRIVAINSDAFLSNLEGWQEIDSGSGDKFYHAQNNYFSKPLFNDNGLFNYKLVDGKPVERTEEELQAEYVPPVIVPSFDDRLEKLEAGINVINALLKKLGLGGEQ